MSSGSEKVKKCVEEMEEGLGREMRVEMEGGLEVR